MEVISYGFCLQFCELECAPQKVKLVIPKSAIKGRNKIFFVRFFSVRVEERKKKQYEVLIETMQGVMEHGKN